MWLKGQNGNFPLSCRFVTLKPDCTKDAFIKLLTFATIILFDKNWRLKAAAC